MAVIMERWEARAKKWQSKEDNKQSNIIRACSMGTAAIIANKCRRNHFLVVTPIYPPDPFPLGRTSWPHLELFSTVVVVVGGYRLADYSNFRCDAGGVLVF